MTHAVGRLLAVLALAGLAVAAPAHAWDPAATFAKGTVVVSPEVGGGARWEHEGFGRSTDISFVNAGVRFSLLPWGPAGSGRLRGALEVGLEPLYQRYVEPHAFFAGLAAVGRYHFLGLGRVVPYVELAAAAGGTDLRVLEIDSSFTFLLFGGVGISVFVTDRTAIYAGYRLQHVSNGNIDQPNRGFEAHTGVVGVSFFLP